MPQMENVVFQVTVAKINHENSNPNGEALTIHKEKDRVRGQEELPTPQHQRIDDEPVEMPQMDNASAKQLKDSVEKLEALLRFTQNDYVRADCKEGIAFLKDKIAAMIAMQALQVEVVPVRNAARSWLSEVPLGPGDRVLAISKTTQLANAVIGRNSSSTLQHQFSLAPKRSFSQANVASAASPVVQNHFDLQIEAAQVAAKEALQGEIVTARIAAAPVDSRFDHPIEAEQVAAKEAFQGEIVTARIADKSWKSELPFGPGKSFSQVLAKVASAASPVVNKLKPFLFAFAGSPVVQKTFDQPIATEQVAAKEALQGEIVTAIIAAAPVESRTNQAVAAVAASKSTKQPVPANFNPATCPCPGKNKNPYAHFRSEKHELWMAMNAAAAVGIDQPIAAVKPHLQM